MNPPSLLDRRPGTLPSTQPRSAPRSATPVLRDMQRDIAAAHVLVAQAYFRMGVALAVTMVQLAILGWRGAASPAMLLGITLLYAVSVGVLAIGLGKHRAASPNIVSLALLGDLTFVYAITYAGTTPAHYTRALFGAMLVVHLAFVYFGRRQAWRTVIAACIGYLLLAVGPWRGTGHIDKMEELWTLAVGAGAILVVIVQAGHVRRRLKTIVTLFERAEEGDFSQAYDEAADSRPDAITRVGRAYNRVRMQLASMVLTDPLTGCLNRRGFDQALAREVARSSRAGSDLALLALDLDHFKQINDNHGHLAGDEVLRAAGSLLLQTARAGDVVARTGGEEFCVILPDTSAAGAFQLATRICEVLRGHTFEPNGARGVAISVTTSIGVVSGPPDIEGDSAALFTARADAALYAAKRSGRDRVRAWSEGIGTGEDDRQLVEMTETARHRVTR